MPNNESPVKTPKYDALNDVTRAAIDHQLEKNFNRLIREDAIKGTQDFARDNYKEWQATAEKA